MWLKKRKKIQRNRNRRKPFIFIGCILLFIVTLVLLFRYPIKLPKNFSFISPLSKEQQETIGDMQSKLKKKNIPFVSIVPLDDVTYMVNLENNSKVIFSTKNDMTQEISSLQLVLARLTIEGKKFSILDFRFDKPVIRYEL